MKQGLFRLSTLGALVPMLVVVLSASPVAAVPAPSEDNDTKALGEPKEIDGDHTIDKGRTQLPSSEISKAAEQESPDPMKQVYDFEDIRVMVPFSTKLRVWEGRNADGEVVHEIGVDIVATGAKKSGAFATPNEEDWTKNGSGSFTKEVDDWQRDIVWQIDKVNNQDGRDYYRGYVKSRASTATEDVDPNAGYKRSWIEIDRTDEWGTDDFDQFELGQPENSVGVGANQSETVGFGASAGITLGAPPAQVNVGVESSWQTTLNSNIENIHPVIRGEEGSGGNQWCYYGDEEFTGTKTIATRQSVSVPEDSPTGVTRWTILSGQSDDNDRCPTRL